MSKDEILSELKKATDGLLFQSESDYPIEPFTIEGEGRKSITPGDLPIAGGHAAKSPVKKDGIDNFFANAIEEQDWHGPEERDMVKRFQQLVRLLKDNLTDIKVFKIGKAEVYVYVVGKTKSGDFVGVSTKVVET